MSNQADIDAEVVILRIITLMLVMGVLAFGIYVTLIAGALDPQQPPPPGLTTLSYAGGIVAIINFLLHLIVPDVIARQMLSQATAGPRKELEAFRIKTIIALALLEGAAFLNLFAVMMEHQWWSLVVAGGLVFWMLARFPSRAKIENWIASQQI